MLVWLAWALLCLAGAARPDAAPADANCKGGATLYKEPASGIVGCYKFFSTPSMTWTQADGYCRNTDCAAGFCGALAAARSQGEHDFLVGLAGSGVRFWIAGNSLASDGIWRWSGYGSTVNFNLPWVTTVDSNYAAYPGMAILDGRRSPYAWDYAQANSSAYGYVCRKDACSPTQDILGGICSGAAPSVQTSASSSITWIAAPIILGVVVVGLTVFLVFLWKYKNGTYNRWKKRITRGYSLRISKAGDEQSPAAAQALRIQELTEENQRLRTQLESLLADAEGPTSGGTGGGTHGPASGNILGLKQQHSSEQLGHSNSTLSTSGNVATSLVGPATSMGMAASTLPTVAGLPRIRRTSGNVPPQGALAPMPGVGVHPLEPQTAGENQEPSTSAKAADRPGSGTAAVAEPAEETGGVAGGAEAGRPAAEAHAADGTGSGAHDAAAGDPSSANGPAASFANFAGYSSPAGMAAEGPGAKSGGPTLFQRAPFGSNKVAPAFQVGPPRIVRNGALSGSVGKSAAPAPPPPRALPTPSESQAAMMSSGRIGASSWAAPAMLSKQENPTATPEPFDAQANPRTDSQA